MSQSLATAAMILLQLSLQVSCHPWILQAGSINRSLNRLGTSEQLSKKELRRGEGGMAIVYVRVGLGSQLTLPFQTGRSSRESGV
jgi:hypothetical protein